MMYEVLAKLAVLTVLTYITYRYNFLDLKALLLALFMGFIILFLGGWSFFTLLAIFLFVGSFMSRLSTDGSIALRSWRNVLANGFWPTVSILLYSTTLFREYGLLMFLGSLNAMFSDTLSTEVGMYFGGEPRLITDPKRRVKKGLSGGVTLTGILGGLLASIGFSILAYILLYGRDLKLILYLFIAGVLSSIVDSLLGSTLQAKYKCDVCGETVEYTLHCNTPTVKLGGYEWMNNHTVNFFTSLFGGLITILLFKFI